MCMASSRAFLPIIAGAVWYASLLGLADADVAGSRYQSGDEWGVRITAPTNWDISQQTSYPNILLWMYRRTPAGKMLLSVECMKDKSSSREYAERTAKTLESFVDGTRFQIGRPQLHAATGAYWIEFDNGETFLRQALLVSGDVGYSLTLSANDADTRRKHLRAWDYSLRSIRIDRKGKRGVCSRRSE
jgi:hypothetical protein